MDRAKQLGVVSTKILFHAAVLFSLTATTFLSAKNAGAVETKDVTFSDIVTTGEWEFHLRGTGTLKWKIFFSVYSAALYLPREVPSDAVFEDVPKRLEFHYLVDIEAETFPKSAAPFLEKNLDGEVLAMLEPKIASINRLYRDVKHGDRYTLTYTPGNGTTLALNGEELGTIDGKEFASAYFRIWLGEEPISESLRRSLLKEGKESEEIDY